MYHAKYQKYKSKYLELKKQNNRKPMNFELAIRDPWLTYIMQGIKTVEGRRYNDRFYDWIGHKVRFFNQSKEVFVKVIGIRHYPDLKSYLNGEGYNKVLPGIKSFQEALDIYHQFYSDEDIKKSGGMMGIVVELID
jgi:ASC-1-like (ASCH) protein